ncbi:MAG: hypothetical protein ACHREM_01175 [Polyangiales bacterium]
MDETDEGSTSRLFGDGGLLETLDEADTALRAMYRELADDPDRLGDGGALSVLQRRRLDLATLTGLAMLAASRAQRAADADVVASAPEPVSDAEPVVVAPPVPAETVKAWAERFQKERKGVVLCSTSARAAPPPAPLVAPPLRGEVMLATLLRQLGAPRTLAEESQLLAEIEALESIASEDSIRRWEAIPRSLYATWLSMIVVRVRAAREICGAVHQSRMRKVIGDCAAWARDNRPEWVNGLQFAHVPKGTTWDADGRELWDTLQTALETRNVDGPLRPHSAAPRTVPKKEDAEPVSVADEEPPLTLTQLEAAEGTIIIVGNGERSDKLARLQSRTSVKIEWWDCQDSHRIARRIGHGHVSGLIVLEGFVDHSYFSVVTDAARLYRLPIEYANRGGLSMIVAALQALDERLGKTAIAS